MRIAITGANSSVGRALLSHVAGQDDVEARAGVRTEQAAATLLNDSSITPCVISYRDANTLAALLDGVGCLVHMAGILVESHHSSYQTANVDTTQAVVDACRLANVDHIVLISTLGADVNSVNHYCRSKGEAEEIVKKSGIASTIIRTSILLGPGTAGAKALVGSASRASVKVLGGGRHLLRPLDVDDLSDAILFCCRTQADGVVVHELVGPESVTHRDLIATTGHLMGRNVSITAVPIWAARLGAAMAAWIRRGGMTPTVIDVITADETVRTNADADLGVNLTPLSATLEKLVTRETRPESKSEPGPSGSSNTLGRIVFLGITAGCFTYLYYRLDAAAAREGQSLVEYMTQVFANVQWLPWLVLMMVYSGFYFLVDTLVVTRALGWFVKPIGYRDILPIRASAYIISIFNEQIGKGAMAYYLNRRDQVPGWEVASVMLFIMFCEVFYLLIWATIGFAASRDSLPEVFGLIPYIAVVGALVFVGWLLYFQGRFLGDHRLRDRKIFHAFKLAALNHYMLFFLLRSPALLAAVFVYTFALRLFGVEASFLTLLGYLPIIFFAAAVPTPMRAAAITFWVVLFPENEGQMAAFGFVQHNFFILFNALIGVAFWPRAQRELFRR